MTLLLEKICGIYVIRNKVNNKCYVGLSVNIKHRLAVHLSALRGGYEENPYLQNSWNKYCEENFEFDIVELCEREFLPEREIYWIKKLKTNRPNGYNILKGGNIPPSNKGTKFSKSHRKKISEKLKGNKNGSSQKGIKKPGNNKYCLVGYIKSNNTWCARIKKKNGKMKMISGFLTEKDAAIGRDYLLWKEYGCEEKFNFPENLIDGKYIKIFKRTKKAEKFHPI